MDIGLLPR